MLSYLALGDSYTIAEAVPLHDSFPYQTVQLLRKKGLALYAPEIVAKTGWTTDELTAHVDTTAFNASYDFVSLLIGVNNQYRGRDIENFQEEFIALLNKAISFAGGKKEHVFVLSIPDWGVTPFAKERDASLIASQIDQYNAMCEKVAAENGCHYIDITAEQRATGNLEAFLATDGLHPSGAEYAKWANKLADAIASIIL